MTKQFYDKNTDTLMLYSFEKGGVKGELYVTLKVRTPNCCYI